MPATKNHKIVRYVVGGVFGQPSPVFSRPSWSLSQLLFSRVTLLFVLFTKVKPRVTGGKEALEVQDHNLEEGGNVPEVFDG